MRIFSIAFFNAVLCNLPRMIVGVCSLIQFSVSDAPLVP